MKKVVLSGLFLIALLALTTGVVFAGSALELVEVRNDDGQPKFVFRVSGAFSQKDLSNGLVIVGNKAFPLYCAQTNPNTLVCHTSKAAVGQKVVVSIGGARFWGYVPEQVVPAPTDF